MRDRRVARLDRGIEWPTIALAIVIYGGWLALTFIHEVVPLPVLVVLGGWLTAWHASLQHEIIHGHPTRWRRFNRALGTPPLFLWLTFESYRATHLVHHRDERLTDPLDDPESFYWTPEQWASLSPLHRRFVEIQTTLLGRLTIGPFWIVGRYLGREWRDVVRGDRRQRRIWARHALHVGLIVGWLVIVCGMPVWLYLAAFVYPGTALMLLRSFAEHRAAEGVAERTAIVENAPALGLLYLYNNLHAVHHEQPMLPWYMIPGWYQANRGRLVAANGGLVYAGYLDVARRYLLKPYQPPLHPTGHRAGNGVALESAATA